MEDVCLVLMTAPDEGCAVSIAQTVVSERLAACGNLIPRVRSIYRWQDKICDDAEILVLFKTTKKGFDALKKRIVSLHPYDCPEVIAVDVSEGHADYLAWVVGQVGE